MNLELCRSALRRLDQPLLPLADPALRWEVMVQAQQKYESESFKFFIYILLGKHFY